ncbi:hypothetical protein BC829DRAFT_256080 [Chytridium lagenaria]|nr:hypothetical protein BC829DRAFT_256080 [Chytridium lagenaria]
MPRTSPEPIPTSIHNADNTSSQSIKSVPSVDEEPDYNSDSVNGNDSTAPPSSSTSSPYTRNSTPSLSPLPTDPPRHRQSRLRSYQFLFSGTSKHRVEESSTASQAETFDTEATKDASIDPTPIEPEKPRRTRKHTHSVFLNTQSRWSLSLSSVPYPPQTSTSSSLKKQPYNLHPTCDMDGLHPVDASSHHPARHSLDVVVAANIWVSLNPNSPYPSRGRDQPMGRSESHLHQNNLPTTSAGHINDIHPRILINKASRRPLRLLRQDRLGDRGSWNVTCGFHHVHGIEPRTSIE